MQGFDFAFLRRSRLYDECSEKTGHKWDSQYIGGNTLAVCNGEASPPGCTQAPRTHTDVGFWFSFLFPEALFPISGVTTAYFPKNQDCVTTKSNSDQQRHVLDTFIRELRNQDVDAEPQHACLVCGEQRARI